LTTIRKKKEAPAPTSVREVELEPRYVRLPEAMKRAGDVSRMTLANWERDGEMPRRRRIGPATTGWLESEFNAWLISRKAVTGGAGRSRS